ncbi:hypothetical protein Ddye_019680 [Dipteronia dyeriana]|uniref:Uncharacterized protein n=1 Tax=Dipteronia dyeriana TaxID=168575 RepID=A0AAD9TZD3_9ROSI|nr:hypothetical protein Ddye_019680 [Dipteronia dyeriana]
MEALVAVQETRSSNDGVDDQRSKFTDWEQLLPTLFNRTADGFMRRNAATAYPKPSVCFQGVAREGKEVELFHQVVILGTRLLISTATQQ